MADLKIENPTEIEVEVEKKQPVNKILAGLCIFLVVVLILIFGGILNAQQESAYNSLKLGDVWNPTIPTIEDLDLTEGSLIVGNASDLGSALSIGTNGYVLTSNGTTAVWQASVGGSGSGAAWEKYTGLASPLEIITPTTTNASIYLGGGVTSTKLTVTSLDGSGGDVKIDANGRFYIGTDADSGGAEASNWNEYALNVLTPTNTSAGIWIEASSTIDADFHIQGNATTTGHIASLGGNSDQWNMCYDWGDHSTQNYLDLDTYPDTDTDATDDFDGAFSSLTGLPQFWATDTEQYFWNNTSTWTGSQSEWNKYTNASSTIITEADLTAEGYLTSVAYTDLTGNPSDVISAGTNISWDTDTLNVDDAFLVNNANDETSGGITMNSVTTTDSAVIGGYLTVTGTITGTLTGNASTATALASNGGNCGAGEYPLGVDASGAVENCTDATTEINSAIATHNSPDYHRPTTSLDYWFTNTAGIDTDGLTEGSSNFYYTDAKVQDYINTSSTIQTHFTNADLAYAGIHDAVSLTGQDYLTLSTQQITVGEIQPDDLAGVDFGGFTCNGTTCSIDAGYTASWDLLINKPATSTILSLLNSDYRIAKIYASSSQMSLASSTQWEGGGLADCDTAATSKLLWDATTKQFSCGTDQTGGAWAWTTTDYGMSTSTIIGFTGGMMSMASSTFTADVRIDGNATTTGSLVVADFTATGDIILPNDSITDAMLDWGNFTDLSAGGVVDWANLAEGELATGVVVTDDIKDGTIAFADFGTDIITGAEAVGTFESGDTFLCMEAGVGVRECDYDNLPGVSSGLTDINSSQLGQLVDVATTTLTAWDILNWDGSNWVDLATTTFLMEYELAAAETDPNVDSHAEIIAIIDNTATDVGSGVWTFAGVSLAENENITLGSQTLDHDGTDFVFSDSVSITGNATSSAHIAATEFIQNGTSLANIYSPLAGSASITTVGTIGTGVWQGTAISPTYLDSSVIISTEIDAFSEIQAIVADKTLVNEEDAATWDATQTFSIESIFTTGARMSYLNATSSLFDHSTTTGSIYIGANLVRSDFTKSMTIASSTWAYAGSSNIPLAHLPHPVTITNIWCETDGGTSVAITLSDGSNSTESIVCDEDGATDDGSITNGTFTSNERIELDIGEVTGAVNWLNINATFKYD